MAQTVKNSPALQETGVWSLGWEDPLEKGMATHSSILAWRIPWTEDPSGLQSMGSQRVGHNWVPNTHTRTHTHTHTHHHWIVLGLPLVGHLWNRTHQLLLINTVKNLTDDKESISVNPKSWIGHLTNFISKYCKLIKSVENNIKIFMHPHTHFINSYHFTPYLF